VRWCLFVCCQTAGSLGVFVFMCVYCVAAGFFVCVCCVTAGSFMVLCLFVCCVTAGGLCVFVFGLLS
jgi:hypothetical protein